MVCKALSCHDTPLKVMKGQHVSSCPRKTKLGIFFIKALFLCFAVCEGVLGVNMPKIRRAIDDIP